MPNLRTQVDVEFSPALTNRTGKYFICRDMIEELASAVGRVRFWRVNSVKVPDGFRARLLNKLMWWELSARESSPWLRKTLPRIRSANPLIFTDPLQVILYRLKLSDMVIIHDLGPLTHPQLYDAKIASEYKLAFQEIAHTSPRLIFVSRASQLEYERLFGEAYASCSVIYPNMRIEITGGDQEPVIGVTKPFLLSVGAIGTRKNFANAIRAFSRSGLEEQGVAYVICGSGEPGYDEVLAVARSTTSTIVTGYVSDNQLKWLYANAAGFVLPSLLEGFGIPAAEAVLKGLIPIISAGGALQEVVGDNALLVDPLDLDSIATAMRTLMSLTPQQKSERLAALTEHLSSSITANNACAWRAAILGTA